jgi:hypothetical protein
MEQHVNAMKALLAANPEVFSAELRAWLDSYPGLIADSGQHH